MHTLPPSELDGQLGQPPCDDDAYACLVYRTTDRRCRGPGQAACKSADGEPARAHRVRRSGADTKQFFEATRGASLAQIEAQLAPELKAKAVDPELFAAFVKEIATRFGALESIKSDEFSDNLNGSRRSRQFKGLFVFEKRELSMIVGFLGDQLSTLIVHDPVGVEIADAVTRVPTDTAIYVKGGQRYLEAMLGGRTDEAFDMLAEDKQKTMDRAEFMKWGREVTPRPQPETASE